MDALKDFAQQLGFDQSFYFLFALVCVLYLLLSSLFLKPFQKLIHDRRSATDGVKKKANELMVEAEEKLALYKQRLREVNEKAREIHRQNEESARKEEVKIVGDATAKAKASLQEAQKELDVQRKEALTALSGEISGMAAEIATKVMGRPLGTTK